MKRLRITNKNAKTKTSLQSGPREFNTESSVCCVVFCVCALSENFVIPHLPSQRGGGVHLTECVNDKVQTLVRWAFT